MSGGSLGRNSRVMAVGTVASRVTGFGRTAMLVAVLGLSPVQQAFLVANTLPNSLYELLLGGILTSSLVPLLVEAKKGSGDDGTAYAQRLLSLVVLALGTVSVLSVLLAPWLVDLYLETDDPDQRQLAVAWARFFLPQILFYGVSATIGAVLNTRDRFAAPMWAPVLNNVVVIATLGVFLLVPGPEAPGPSTISDAQLVVLGVGTTLGIAAMTAALLPSLRATGFRWRLRLDVRGMGLRRAGRLAAWVLLYVGVTQAAYVVVTRLATAVVAKPEYDSAFVLWQLPHAVVAVSVITALLPRMSRSAVDGRLDAVRSDVDRGLRLASFLLVPAALAFVVLGREIAVIVYAHGNTTVPEATRVGLVLAVFAVGLVPFSSYQLQARAFYAMRDTKTPALVQVAVMGVLVVADLVAAAVLSDDLRVYGLAGGHACAYLVGVLVSAQVLRRRVGPAGSGTLPALGRLLAAGLVGAGVAAAVRWLLVPLVPAGWVGAVAVLAAAAAAGGVAYLGVGALLRVPEVATMGRYARSALGRLRG